MPKLNLLDYLAKISHSYIEVFQKVLL